MVKIITKKMKTPYFDRDWTHFLMTGELKKNDTNPDFGTPPVDLRDVVYVPEAKKIIRKN